MSEEGPQVRLPRGPALVSSAYGRRSRAEAVRNRSSVWAGLFAPKGVVPEVVARLADALDKALDEPVARERLAQLGGSIPSKAERSPAAFDRFVRRPVS